ncbi:MAG TPA: helix-turn-helix domain-containing protein [Spongiibacteraceae bacterium]
MRVALAVTRESIISVVATAYEVIDFCARMQHVGVNDSQLFAVSSEPESAFMRRFGFIEFLDSRLSVPVDWVFIPALEIARPWTAAQYKPLLQWLRRSAERGALITSVGTGSFLLAEAGLLDGKEAVTYSQHADYFAARYPNIYLRRDTNCVRSEKLLLSGDMPWQELLLTVIGEHWGTETAQMAANTYALHWEHLIDAPAVTTALLDPVTTKAQQWLSEHIDEHDLLNRCCEHLSLSRRTFNRRFKEATGMTPLDFVHHARLQTSQNLLMFTNRSVEEICYNIGYDDIGAFYKLFRRHLGTSPNKFRKQFAGGRL